MEWISVKDKLPEIKGNGRYAQTVVIACYDGDTVIPMIYERTTVRGEAVERWKFYWDRIADVKVTHWMPLPEPPKMEQEGKQ